MKTLAVYSPTSSLGLLHGHDVSWMRMGHELAQQICMGPWPIQGKNALSHVLVLLFK